MSWTESARRQMSFATLQRRVEIPFVRGKRAGAATSRRANRCSGRTNPASGGLLAVERCRVERMS